MRKLCVWGTGKFASYYSYMHSESIYAYIDNDRAKKGAFFNGKKVLHPSEIEDWKSFFIIISSTYFEDVSAQLREYGLQERIDYKKETFIPNGLSTEFVYRQFDQYLGEIKKHLNTCKRDRKKLIFWGAHYEFEQIVRYDFIEKISVNDEMDVFLISDTRHVPYENYKKTNGEFSIALFGLPFIFSYRTFVLDGENNASLNNNENNCLYQNTKELIDQMDDDPSYEKIRGKNGNKIALIIEYIDKILDLVKPNLILCMDSVQPVHRILRTVVTEKGIPMVFTHQGIIPGTIAFDPDGEVGESIPALHPKEFNNLDIDKTDTDEAERIISFLARSRANRKVQPTGLTIYDLKRKIETARKTVFFAAQNDVRSYMVPYTEHSRKYYSPIFRSSVEAANYIAGICKKNGWNIVYKPHPMYIKDDVKTILSDNIIYIEECDVNDLIDVADLTVTILSSISYNSLVRNTPVLMLGYGWLKESGCTYEAYIKETIEKKMQEAMIYGFTKEQKASFIRYTAICNKYYVFDDEKEREIRYGKKMPEAKKDLYCLQNLIRMEIMRGTQYD